MSRGLLRWALAAMIAAPLAVGARAQNPPPQQEAPPAPALPPQQGAPPDTTGQLPTFRADINFVRVDVIVSDKQGNPVNDLRQQDFEVSEDGKPQSIQTFKLINTTDALSQTAAFPPRQIRSMADEESEANREDTRLFAFFLDDYHVRLENSMRARGLIADFVQNQLQPADMAVVMYPLMPIGDLLLSRNRSSVAGAIRAFTGRKYDYTPRNLIEERYVHYVSTMEAERIRNQVSLSALKGLIIRLGGLREARKTIIAITEGYTNVLPAQAVDPIASMPGSGGQSRPDPISPDPMVESRRQSSEFFLQTDMLGDIRSVTELANRFNTAIYTVDPRGLTPFEFDLSRANISLTSDQKILDNTMDTLRIIADETDGRAIVNQNDLEPGLKQILRDSSAYYLLGYTTTQSGTDGKFHEIKVRVKRPGVQVRSRKGYLALNAREAERALAPAKPGPPPAILQALGALSVPARRSPIATWVGMSPGSNGKTKVSLVWAPAPPRPGGRAETPAKISLIAGNANSDLFYRNREVAPGRVDFEVPPGPIDLEIAVMDAGTDVLDRETRKLDVPALGLGLTISTPEVFRGRTLPEWQKLATDRAALPAIEREFRRTDRLLLRVGAQSAGGPPTIAARLLNRDGGEMSVLPVAAAGFGDLSNVDVSLAALPPGDYLIEIKATEGPESTVSLLAIRVTG